MPNIAGWVEAFGLFTALLLIGVIVFAESGLLIGIFLPGDTLLIAAGILVAQGHMPLLTVMTIIFVAAVLGDNVGYFFGRRTGSHLLQKKDGIFFRRSYALRAELFFKRHGAKTVLLARFIPYIRTFTPIVAGIAKMHRPTFILYNVLSALSWTVVTVLLGYWLGNRIPDITNYLWPAATLGTLIVFSPTIWHLLGTPEGRHHLGQALKQRAKKRHPADAADEDR